MNPKAKKSAPLVITEIFGRCNRESGILQSTRLSIHPSNAYKIKHCNVCKVVKLGAPQIVHK